MEFTGLSRLNLTLSTEELRNSAEKIKNIKEQAPRDLAILRKTEHITLARPGRPFGVLFSFQSNISLETIAKNWLEINKDIGVVNNWLNMIIVLNKGLILIGKPKNDETIEPFLETDSLVNFTLQAQEGKNDGFVVPIIKEEETDTLMWFYFYLTALLSRTFVVPVDIGKYIDNNLPPMIHSVL